MKRIWKRAGLAVVGLALAAGALVFFAPVGGFKAPVEAAVTDATGRPLHVQGPLSLTLSPNLGLDLGPVTLGAGQGKDGTPLVAARRAVLAIAFLPLISGEARATGLTLHGADIVVAGPDGWRFSDSGGEQLSSPFDAAPFGDVRLIDSRLVVDGITIEAHDLRLRWAEQGQSLSLSGEVGFRETAFSIDAVVERRDALFNGGRVPLRLEFRSSLAEGSLDGLADLGALRFEGGIALSAPSTRALAAFLGAIIPGERRFGELSLSAALEAEPGEVRLSDIRFALGDVSGAGSLGVRLAGSRPSFSGAVAIDRFHLANWLTFQDVPSADGWRDATFDLSGLKAFDAEMTVRARAADLLGLEAQNLALTLSVRSGRLWARIDKALAYAALINGALTAETAAGTPQFSLTLNAEGFDAQTAFAALFDASGLAGRADAKLDLTAQGGSRRALIQSLAGKADIALIDGTLDGIDPAAIARSAADEAGVQGIGPDEAVSFKRLSGAFTILNGQARTDDLRLVTARFRMQAAGHFDLPARTLALRALPAFTADVDGTRDPADEGRLAIPFALTGPWATPAVSADWRALASAVRQGDVSEADLTRLPEPARGWFTALLASGEEPPLPDGIAPPERRRFPRW